MFTQKLRLAATSLFLFVGLTTALFGTLPAQTVLAAHEPGHSATEEGDLNAGDNTAASDGCLSANPLSWFGCGVLALIDEALDWLNKTINSLLFIDPLPDNIEKSWAVFRNLAYIVLVPMMLFMVIGTAINMGPFDPYTVKKALPRMFVAVVFIALSLPICSFFVNISNVLGNGAGNIITSLSGIDQLADTEGAGTNTSGIIGAGVLYGLAGGITWGIVGSLGLVMVVGLLIGFFTLVLRQVLVVMLIILAPIAILVWIFPGNDKLWNVWRTTFTAMLLLYPLVAILIASGKFFAATVLTTGIGGDRGTVSQLVAMTAYIAPFFLIPSTFKYGMGIFGNLAGMVNDRGRGFFDRQRKFREGSRSNARQKALAGKRFAGGNENNWRGRYNKAISRSMNAPGAVLESGALLKPGDGRWAGAIDQREAALKRAEIERNKKENLALHPWMGDDDVSKAANESYDANSLRTRLLELDDANAKAAAAKGETYAPRFSDPGTLEETVAGVEAVRRSMSTGAFKQMTSAQAIAGGTAHADAYEAWKSVALSTGTDASSVAAAVAEGRSASMAAGNVDIGGAGFGTTLGAVQKIQQAFANAGPNGPDEAALRKEINKMIQDDVYESQGGATLVHSSMKPRAVERMSETMVDTVDTALHSDNPRRLMQDLASLGAVYEGLRGSSPKKARIMADKVMSKEIDVASLSPEIRSQLKGAIEVTRPAVDSNGAPVVDAKGKPVMETFSRKTITYQQAIDGSRGNQYFQEMNREYASQVDAVRNQQLPPNTPPGAQPQGPNTPPA